MKGNNMICPNCQNENTDGSNFCNNCGNALTTETKKAESSTLSKVFLILCFLFLAPFSILTFTGLFIKKSLNKEGSISFSEFTNTFRIVLGWFFATMFFFMIFSEKNPLCILLVLLIVGLLCPYTSNIIESRTKLHNYGKIKAISIIVLFMLIGIISGSTESNKQEVSAENKSAIKDNVKTEKPKTNTRKKEAEYKAPIEDGAYDILPTEFGKGYDKTIKKHGVANIKKSNELLPKAAEIVSRNKTCDKITWVMLSDNSTRDNIIIITDCNNGKRFYLSEQEILQNVSALSESQKLEKLMPTHIAMCEARIKNSLNYPSTYKKLISKTGWETEDYVNDIVIGFKAKNAFNLETEYTARCMLNSNNDFSTFSIKENY